MSASSEAVQQISVFKFLPVSIVSDKFIYTSMSSFSSIFIANFVKFYFISVHATVRAKRALG